MKKLILLLAYCIPFMVYGQAITLEGPTESCIGEQDAWTMTVNDDCVCSIDIFAFNGVECNSGQSSFTLDSPFPPNGPAGCENQFQTGVPLPFDMCWESLTGIICVTPVFCDGTRGRSSCRLITESEDCNKEECDPSTIEVIGSEYFIEVCQGNSWFDIEVTPGFTNYQWSISPSGPSTQIYATGGPYAMIRLSNTVPYENFTVTITAEDCNGNTVTTQQHVLIIPCGWGGGVSPHDDPEEETSSFQEMPIKIHPNPSSKSQEITISGLNSNFEHTNFEIIDAAGKVLQTGTIRSDEARIQLTGQLISGVYFIRFIVGDKTSQVKKITIRD